MRRVLPLAFILLLAACGSQTGTPTPPEEPPATTPPNIPSDPNAVPFAGEWLVSYVSSTDSSDAFTYALNITLKAPTTGNFQDGGIGLAIKCESNTSCEYPTGAQTAGYGFISNLELADGTAPLSVAIFEDSLSLFYFTTDTNNALETDVQGRQVLEGLGAWESSPGQYTPGLVTAIRVGNAKTLQQSPNSPPPGQPIAPPTPPTDPTPPTPPSPPNDPEPISKPPVINGFTANPRSIETGDSTTLAWDVDNADTLRISPDIGRVTGSNITVKPDKTTTYTITATNTDGSDDVSVKITVQDPKPPEPKEAALRYWVNSDCGRVSTTYATADGGTAQRDFGNGYVYTVDSGVRSGTFLYISAQNQCAKGDVTVRIYKRGSVYKETSSLGAYVIATASGTY